MKSFRAVANTQNQVLTVEDIEIIFSKISELHQVHNNFLHELQPVVDHWTPESCVGTLFKILVSRHWATSCLLWGDGREEKNVQK